MEDPSVTTGESEAHSQSKPSSSVNTTEGSIDSPSTSADRIEFLIRKYKTKSQTQTTPTTTNSAVAIEVEEWVRVGERMELFGYQPVTIRAPIHGDWENECMLSVNHSRLLRQTLMEMMDAVERKDKCTCRCSQEDGATLQVGMGSGHLHSAVTELQYSNAKLKVDLLNRPEAEELKTCQRRVRELERELQQHKNALSSEQLDVLNCKQQLQNICLSVGVTSGEEVIPQVSLWQNQLFHVSALTQHLSKVVSTVLDTPLPSPQTNSTHSHTLCPDVWARVEERVQEWHGHMTGMKALVGVFNEVCHTHNISSPLHTEMSCLEMASLLKEWLLCSSSNKKLARLSALAAIVNHFQQLFDVPSVGGVYPTMSRVYQLVQESSTAYKQLVTILMADGRCSWERVVSLVQHLVDQKDGQLMMVIHKRFGSLTADQVLEQLTLCQEFFPTFHTLLSEIQTTLGVESISAVLPAIRKMCLAP